MSGSHYNHNEDIPGKMATHCLKTLLWSVINHHEWCSC